MNPLWKKSLPQTAIDASLVAAVEEGRHVWNNLQKAILYTLPTNAAQALLIMGAILSYLLIKLSGVAAVRGPLGGRRQE